MIKIYPTCTVWYKMRAFLCLLGLVCFSSEFHAQYSGTIAVPSSNFPNLKAAIDSLNLYGLAGNTTVVLAASNPQTAPVSGYVLGNTGSALLTTLSPTKALTFNGNGNSITAPSQTAGGLLDAVFKIIGGDYITWNGFSINAGAGSTTGSATNDKTEFGFAFLALSATDGCQNNTIQNCSIDMGSTPYQNQFGVYFSNSHSTTAITTSQASSSISGSNSNNKIIGNAITGAPIGVLFLSAPITAANAQTGNEVNNNAITVVGCPAAISGYSSYTTTAHSAGIE
jgi:hypothetical protein